MGQQARGDEADAAIIFEKARGGEAATAEERAKFTFYLMVFLGRLDAARGWTKQLHLGAARNVNPRGFQSLGPDAGYDTIGDHQQGPGIFAYLGTLSAENALPKIILYNLNPADNYLFAALTGGVWLREARSARAEAAHARSAADALAASAA